MGYIRFDLKYICVHILLFTSLILLHDLQISYTAPIRCTWNFNVRKSRSLYTLFWLFIILLKQKYIKIQLILEECKRISDLGLQDKRLVSWEKLVIFEEAKYNIELQKIYLRMESLVKNTRL